MIVTQPQVAPIAPRVASDVDRVAEERDDHRERLVEQLLEIVQLQATWPHLESPRNSESPPNSAPEPEPVAKVDAEARSTAIAAVASPVENDPWGGKILRHDDGTFDLLLTDVPAREALSRFAAEAGLNVVVRGDVQASLTLALHQATAEDIMAALLQAADATAIHDGGMMYVTRQQEKPRVADLPKPRAIPAPAQIPTPMVAPPAKLQPETPQPKQVVIDARLYRISGGESQAIASGSHQVLESDIAEAAQRLESSGSAAVIAQPRVSCCDRQPIDLAFNEATCEGVSRESALPVAYLATPGSSAAAGSATGMSLSVRPSVINDRSVGLMVGSSLTGAPVAAVCRSGQTLVIAGPANEVGHSHHAPSLLESLPLASELFQSSQPEAQIEQVVLLISPRVKAGEPIDAAPSKAHRTAVKPVSSRRQR
jgi:hypothetical protein